MLDPETATSTLGETLEVEGVSSDQLYAAMDWLGARQARIEAKLARRHLAWSCPTTVDYLSLAITERDSHAKNKTSVSHRVPESDR